MFPILLGRRGPGRYVGSGGGGDADGLEEQPVVTVKATGDVSISGKVKAGSFGKFVFPLATIVSDRQYTFRYDPDFSRLTKQGKLAMVGFGLKTSNDFHIIGLRGNGSTGLDKYKVYGTPPSGWNKQTGHTEVDGDAPVNGTQAGPNWIRLATSTDGTTYTFSTSPDGVTWSAEYSGSSPTPFTNVSGVTTFGIALWFDNTDTGPFDVVIDQYVDIVASAAWNRVDQYPDTPLSTTFTNGDLTASHTAQNGANRMIRGNVGYSSGKRYFEVLVVNDSGSIFAQDIRVGIAKASALQYYPLGDEPTAGVAYAYRQVGGGGNGLYATNGATSGTPSNFGGNAVIGVALDLDAGKIWFAKDNTWQSAGDPAAGTGAIFSSISGTFLPAVNMLDTRQILTGRFRSADLTYSPPVGFSPWAAGSPVVEATNTSIQESASLTHTVNLPTGIQSGEQLLVFFKFTNSTSCTFPAGWTELFNNTDDGGHRMVVYRRVADGSEASTISVGTSSFNPSAHLSYRISGRTGTPEVGARANAVSTAPNAPSLTPSWGSKRTLWITWASFSSGGVFSAAPSGYGNVVSSAVAAVVPSVFTARRIAEASSEDAGAWTFDSSIWQAATIAIQPS